MVIDLLKEKVQNVAYPPFMRRDHSAVDNKQVSEWLEVKVKALRFNVEASVAKESVRGSDLMMIWNQGKVRRAKWYSPGLHDYRWHCWL